MRRVELELLGPAGWAGRRRVLVVRETQTEVRLLEMATGRRLKIRRSTFEAAKPRTLPADNERVRAAVATLETKNYRYRPKWNEPITNTPIFRALAAYIRQNLGGRWVRAQPWTLP